MFLLECLFNTASVMTADQLACRVPGTLVRNTFVCKGYVTSIYTERGNEVVQRESILHYSFTTTKIQKSSDKSLPLHNSYAMQMYVLPHGQEDAPTNKHTAEQIFKD